MIILEYEVGYRGAFFGCFNRDVEISWEASSTKFCRVYWVDLEKNKHFIGDCPGFYKLPSLKKRNQGFQENYFNELVGILRFEFESIDPEKGVFFGTPRFHSIGIGKIRCVSQGPGSGWLVFDGGKSVYWSETKWCGGDKSLQDLPFTYLSQRDANLWFTEVLGIKKNFKLKAPYCFWVQGNQVSCIEVIDVEGFPPLGWFSSTGCLESWSYSHSEKRFAAFYGKSYSIQNLSFLDKERFGNWELCSFLSSKNQIEVFKDKANRIRVSSLYGFLLFGLTDSRKCWHPYFFEDWLGRRFKSITEQGKIYLFNYQAKNGWKQIGKTESDYDEASIVEDSRGTFWILAESKDGGIFESFSCDGGQSWGVYKMILSGGQFPLLVMSQKGKRMRIVVKGNRLLFSSGDSSSWWSACSAEGELCVREDRFSVLASKDLRESWYLLVCLEGEDSLSEWVSLDECKTWCRISKV